MQPISPSNEEHAFRLIATTIDRMLAAYPTSVEEDEYELSGAAASTPRRRGKPAKVHGARDGRRHAAICSALLEKRLLSATLGTLSHSVQSYTRSASTSGAAETESTSSSASSAGARGKRRGKRRKAKKRATELKSEL